MADKTIKERLIIIELTLKELKVQFENHLSQHKWLVRALVGAVLMVGLNWGWDFTVKVIQQIK